MGAGWAGFRSGFYGVGVLVDFGSFTLGSAFVKVGVVFGVEVRIEKAWAPTGVGGREAVRVLWQTPQWAPILQQFQKSKYSSVG